MRFLRIFFIVLIYITSLSSCFEDNDDNSISTNEIKDFVWKGMNAYYLYKDFKPDLSNNRFETQSEYNQYLESFSNPEELFSSLTYNTDRFSFLVDDYIALEQLFTGTTLSNGMEYGLRFIPNSNHDVFGYVRYVLPNTDAESKGLKRGDIFDKINGTFLYYNSEADHNLNLLNSDSYSISLATYNNNGTPEIEDDNVISGTESIMLTKSSYTENPIFENKIIEVGGNTIGYLMYNGFTGTDTFDTQLNNIFGNFASAGITDLVLDLRYNPGGSVRTTTWLASMITGQFTDQVFIKEQWNTEIQEQIEAANPSFLINPFVNEMIKTNTDNEVIFQQSINHLFLNKVYILTTKASASASELIINGLNPYIDVVQIGTNTTGKYQASTTLYDSPDFNRQDANPNHTYAIQPLIFKSLNVDGNTDYDEGLPPTITLNENYGNLGVLGKTDEPLLATAIAHIEGTSRISNLIIQKPKDISDSNMLTLTKNRMYTDKKLPILE